MSQVKPIYRNHARNGVLDIGSSVKIYFGVAGEETALGIVTGWGWYCDMHKRLGILSPIVRLEEKYYLNGKQELPVPIFSLSLLKEGVEGPNIDWQKFYMYA